MTNIRMRMRRPALTGLRRLHGSSLWVSTRAVDAGTGLLLPAPLQVAHDSSIDVILEDVRACSPEDGWCWVVTTWADGVIVDARAVLVPVSDEAVDFEDLEVVDPRTLDPTNIDFDAWRFLRESVIQARDEAESAAGLVPDGAERVEGTDFMTFTRGGAPILDPIALVPGPQGMPGPNAIPTDEAVAAYITNVGEPTQTQLAVDGRFFRQGSLAVSVDTFGAVGDGVTDDTSALQTALDSGAEFVYVPTGTYRISESLRVPARVTFYTFTATLVSDEASLSSFINVTGSYLASKKHEIAEPADAGARTLTTKTSHNYAPGDILRLVSQRISTNPEDAGDSQLGWATVGGPGPFFAEFVRVQNVTADTVTLDNGLLFNGYRPDNSQETDFAAGESAYLIDTNGRGDNVSVSGFRFEGEATYGIRVVRAKNVKLRNIDWERNQPGRFIQLNDCYHADVSDCSIQTLQWGESHGEENGVDHAAINQFHVVASWHSGFTNCRSVRGTQPYDFTYAQVSPYPSVYCYVRTSTAEGALHNPVTAHPGTYGIVIADNVFSDCQHAGISIRSNAAEVTHNVVRGSAKPGAVGLYVFEGGGKGSRIESNTVDNFDIASTLNDGGGKPFPDPIDTVFRNNTFRNFRHGWLRRRVAGMPIPTMPQGITLAGNRFESDQPNAIAIITCENGRGINGLTIHGNEFVLRKQTTGIPAILITANTKDLIVDGNVFHIGGRAIDYDSAGNDGGIDAVIWGDNTSLRMGSQLFPINTANFKIISKSAQIISVGGQPNLDDYTTSGKWRCGNSSVQASHGFPVTNVMGWWEVEELTATSIVQRFYEMSGSTRRIHVRRIMSGVPDAWTLL